MTNTRTTLFTTLQVLMTYDFGNFENSELNIGITFDLSLSPSSHVPYV